jgi:hypothetical protein
MLWMHSGGNLQGSLYFVLGVSTLESRRSYSAPVILAPDWNVSK